MISSSFIDRRFLSSLPIDDVVATCIVRKLKVTNSLRIQGFLLGERQFENFRVQAIGVGTSAAIIVFPARSRYI
jgi:CTP-dependent riboflavin kinase